MTEKRVLVVDDEPDMRGLLTKLLVKKCGYEVREADCGDKGLEIAAFWRPDVVITDIKMPGMDGVEFFRRIKEVDSSITTIIMTGYATVEMAVQTVKDGVYDFFEKPFDNRKITHAVSRAMERTELLRHKQRHEELSRRLTVAGSFHGFVGTSPRLLQVHDLLKRLAPSSMTVLIRGESGTGKELAAKALHALSGRAEQSMITVNCPALPEQILESELFGYRRGAFTGADHDKAGLFLEANHSTLLLDEIADIPVAVQTKLLRVLQEKEIQPLGQNKSYPVDVRVIASTNQDIEAKIGRGEFREDLFYRLNVVTVNMPNLEEIRTDLPLLINHFFDRFRQEHGRPDLKLSEEAIQLLLRRTWRGNVRELQNTINRAVLLSSGDLLSERDLMLDRELPASFHEPSGDPFAAVQTLSYAEAKESVLQNFSAAYVHRALAAAQGNISLAARSSGLERQALQRLMRRYNIDISDIKRVFSAR